MLLVLVLLMFAAVLPALPVRTPRPIADAPTAPTAGLLPPQLTSPVTQPIDSAAPFYALPQELVGKPEIVAQRTANTATFSLGNGTYIVLQDTLPLHYQDSAGAWQPIKSLSENLVSWPPVV